MVKNGAVEVEGRRAEYRILDTYDIGQGVERFFAEVKMDGDDEWTALPRRGVEFESAESAMEAVRQFVKDGAPDRN